MKSLNEWQRNNAAWPLIKETGKQILTYDWIFAKWYEKVIIVSSVLWGMFSVARLVFA